MKKTFKLYSIIWCVLLALFAVITFVPFSQIPIKYTVSFWIGFGYVILSFIVQLVCSYFALKEKNIKKTFYNISLITTSYICLIFSFICGCICMLVPILPYWFSVVLCSIALAFNIVSVVKTCMGIGYVSEIDEKIKTKTFFIKALSSEAENLLLRAKSDETKAVAKRVYEAIRYSDPMSNDELSAIEGMIYDKFAKFSDAVMGDDSVLVSGIANDLIALLGDRNSKCKLLK